MFGLMQMKHLLVAQLFFHFQECINDKESNRKQFLYFLKVHVTEIFCTGTTTQ